MSKEWLMMDTKVADNSGRHTKHIYLRRAACALQTLLKRNQFQLFTLIQHKNYCFARGRSSNSHMLSCVGVKSGLGSIPGGRGKSSESKSSSSAARWESGRLINFIIINGKQKTKIPQRQNQTRKRVQTML